MLKQPSRRTRTNRRRTGTSRASVSRAIIFSLLAAALTWISFHGLLDDFAREQVADTTEETIGIYLVSRGINALVSVLQTAEVSVPLLASTQIGEMLDPVNDAVERLSSIVVWALGSLFLQRILLEIASHTVFKWILLSSGLVVVATLWLMEWGRFRTRCREITGISTARLDRCRDWLVRIFMVIAIFHFIVPAFIAVSFLVSSIFLEARIAEDKEKLSLLNEQISAIADSDSVTQSDVESLQAEMKLEQAGLNDLESRLMSAREEAARLDEEIDNLEDEAGWRRLLPSRFGGVSPGEQHAERLEQQEQKAREIEQLEDRIGDATRSLECIERRIRGETCDSFWKKVTTASRTGISHIKETFRNVNDMVTTVSMLLIGIAIKNILFPIVFLLLAVKCSLPIARNVSRVVSGFERDSRKLKGMAMDRLKAPSGGQLQRRGPRR